jgi:lysozyme
MLRKIAFLGFAALAAACSASPDSAPKPECTDSTAEELRRCAAGATVKGVDVSVYQGTVSWAKVRRSGRHFAFARVSDGLSHPDSRFRANWRGMRNAGVARGAYQFFRPGSSGLAQAELFLSKIKAAGGLRAGDLPPVLDIEVTDGHSHAVVVSRAKVWLAHVEKKTGVKPIVYTAAFMSSVIGAHLSGYPLWVANFGATCPTMPTGWSHWRFFQNNDRGSVPGIAGHVDTDLFNGSLLHLKSTALAKTARLEGQLPEGADVPDALDPADDDSPTREWLWSEADPSPEVDDGTDDGIDPGDAIPADGSEGETLGSQSAAASDLSGTPAPCSP